ncbi:Guanylate kinase, related [Neospora caninum Liverpool]|uniref:guanylate kinase n=1 Tax=Neospora caninum (strain Liverpool) TaxID=572307 RepID=F0VE38_NEOCL|nr:Guanylate kinase, related [Neospora caninum Liverpool]CBZ51981.1 Guanylate kinase, related [Neospora caninum Liverpool]|eukprot:XP_003882014.1 Guanylate kinase, related [Neospora caninum Liverpool]
MSTCPASNARRCSSPVKSRGAVSLEEAGEDRTTAAELLPAASLAGTLSPASKSLAASGDAKSLDGGEGDTADASAGKKDAHSREEETPASEKASQENAVEDADGDEPGCDRARATSLKRLLCDSAPPVLVVAGPSGAFGFSISHTSRQPRPGECHGKEYFFCSREEFERLKKEGHFVESAEFSGNCYGTSFAAVDKVRREERICLLEIDMAGVIQIQSTPLAKQAHFVFIKPPSVVELEARLRGRCTEKEEHIAKRLAAAKRELLLAKEVHFDFYLTNDNLEEAWQKLESQLVQWYGPVFDKKSDPGEKKSRQSEEGNSERKAE